jgi:hypothetical protein
MADEDRPGGVTLSARNYMRSIRSSGGCRFARPFNLVPPRRDRQFRTAQLRADRLKRKADRRLAAKLDAGSEEGRAVRGVNIAELARIWSSAGLRDLRADLAPQDEEKFHRQLAAVLAGEEGAATIWHASVSAIREARRAAEVPIGAEPRRWQTYPALNEW